MNRFWNTIIKQVLSFANPAVILEIGAEFGTQTSKLIDYCLDSDCHLHVIDPDPKFEIGMLLGRGKNRVEFYKDTSLNALNIIPMPDVVLIDGDHNWYTVYNELMFFERNSETADRYPLVLLHDVGWPYGRRDMYYNPDTIPEDYLHPCSRKGMLPGRLELVEEGGLNANMYNAERESGERNGVLTAVEDYMKQSRYDFIFEKIEGFHGLGVLCSRVYLDARPDLKRWLENLRNSKEILDDHLRLVESERVEALIEKENAQRETRALQSKVQGSQKALHGSAGNRG